MQLGKMKVVVEAWQVKRMGLPEPYGLNVYFAKIIIPQLYPPRVQYQILVICFINSQRNIEFSESCIG